MLVLKTRIVNIRKMCGHVKIVTSCIVVLNLRIRVIHLNHIGELIVCISLLLTGVNGV